MPPGRNSRRRAHRWTAVAGAIDRCGARLSRTRARPCSQSCTGMERCCATWANPREESVRETRGAETPSTASSANAKPPSAGAGGRPPVRSAVGDVQEVGDARRLREGECRPHRVGGGVPGVLLLVDVVEHLESHRAGVAHRQDLSEEARHVQRALAGEQPVVEAPLANVQVQLCRVRELDVEHLVAGRLCDDGRIIAARQHMEAVETQSERRVVDSLDDPPGILVRTQPSPRHGFVRESQSAPLGADCKLEQLLRRQIVVVDAVRGPRRAAHQDARTELLQQIELPLGAMQARREQAWRDRLDVERLIDLDRQAEARGLVSHAAGRPRAT